MNRVQGASKWWKTCENCHKKYNPRNSQGGRKYCHKCQKDVRKKAYNHHSTKQSNQGTPINRALEHLAAIHK